MARKKKPKKSTKAQLIMVVVGSLMILFSYYSFKFLEPMSWLYSWQSEFGFGGAALVLFGGIWWYTKVKV